jgi:hypothetical protein
MPNEATHRFAMRAFCRSPEKTWEALGLLHEGRIEEGLRLLDHVAEDDVDPVDWREIDIEWLVLTGHCLTSDEGSPQGNVLRHETWQ